MKWITHLLVVAVLVMARGAALGAEERARPAYNVLFIAIDDLRPELGCYGSRDAKTPNIDKLASQSLVFERAYCPVAVCGASRASLMTGIMPTPRRFTNFDTRADVDAPNAATLPQAHRDAGYVTISNGKVFHNQDDTEQRSWSEPAWRPKNAYGGALDPETDKQKSSRGRGRIYEMPDVADDAYPDGELARKTIADLQRLAKGGKPFFLACGFVRPHMPFYAPKKYWDLYDRDKIQIADDRQRPQDAPGALRGSGEFRSYHLGGFDENSEAFHRMMRHGYLASTSYVDQLTGDVLAELERLGLADNTIVVVWGDHGWHLGEHNFWGKHNTMHLAMRIPLIIRVPGKAPARTSALVETIDIFPTLCALTGASVPETAQGRSFATLFDEPGKPFRDVVYNRFGPGDAVITDRFTYTQYKDGSDMLYDLEKDPAENQNVVAGPGHAEVLVRLKEALKQREQEAADAKVKP